MWRVIDLLKADLQFIIFGALNFQSTEDEIADIRNVRMKPPNHDVQMNMDKILIDSASPV